MLNLLTPRLAVTAGIALAAGLGGLMAGHQYASAKGEARLASLQASYAARALDAERQAREQLEAEQRRAAGLATELHQTKTRLQHNRDELNRRIAHVTTNYRPAPDQEPRALPDAVFTWGFVGVWNDALGVAAGRVPADDPAAGADGETGAGDAAGTGVRDPLALSGVSQADLLAHHADYALRCRNIEAQLSAVIDFYQGRPEQ